MRISVVRTRPTACAAAPCDGHQYHAAAATSATTAATAIRSRRLVRSAIERTPDAARMRDRDGGDEIQQRQSPKSQPVRPHLGKACPHLIDAHEAVDRIDAWPELACTADKSRKRLGG